MVKRRKLSDTSKPPSSADDWVQAEDETISPESRPALAKSKDPEYTKMGLYIKKGTHRRMKAKAALEDRELSDVAEEIFSAWLDDKQK